MKGNRVVGCSSTSCLWSSRWGVDTCHHSFDIFWCSELLFVEGRIPNKADSVEVDDALRGSGIPGAV